MLKRILVGSALLAAALFLSACSSAPLSEADQQSMAAAATAPATLQPGDKIRVDVFGEDKLGGEYQTRPGRPSLSAFGGHRQSARHDTGPTRASIGQEIPH